MKLNLTVGRRLILSFTLMLLMVLISSGIGLWYATVVNRAVDASRIGATQIEQVSDLQLAWAQVAASVDKMLLTRQVSVTNNELTTNLANFSDQLEAIQTLPAGQTSQFAAENQAVVDSLQLLGGSLSEVVAELVTLAENQQWARAQALRHTELVSFQRRFDDSLDQLRSNTQNEVDQLIASADAAQTQAQFLWLFTVIIAVIIAFVSAVVTTRSIVKPVQTLIAQAERVTHRDFNPIQPLKRGDEIGQLSQSFALMNDWLRESYQSLEIRVVERTRSLALIAAISERLNAILNIDQLLEQVVEEVQLNFNYYHAHIYLLDERQNRLVVVAGTGQAGTQMKQQRHSIGRDASSLVARAVRTGDIVSVNDVQQSGDWLPNPLLPDTRSEMAVPIVLENRVVGVLDVQSNNVDGLDENDANLLRTLAGQVAIALRNARLFEQTENALVEARLAQERYMETSWANARQNLSARRYLYTTGVAGADVDTAEMADTPAGKETMVMPIQLQNNTLGRIQLKAASDKPGWNDDDLAIVQAVLDQFAQTAENLRLFEETRQRAGREQVIREITDKLRAAPNIDALLETAARELGSHLGVQRVRMKMGHGPQTNGK